MSAMTLVDEWLEHLRTDRGRSTNTLTTYTRTMRSLTQVAPNPEYATRDDLARWWRLRALDAEGNPRPHSSRNNELSAIKMFYKWLIRYDHRDDDPSNRIDQLRSQQRDSRFVGREDLEQLLRELKPEMRRAVALGAYGGLRVSEAAELMWSDVNLEIRRLTVHGKGDKERKVGLPVQLLDIILPNRGGNVVTGKPEGYSAHYLQIKVNEAMRAAGVENGLTFHALRHRFGYMSVAGGVAPTSIARAMGHANLQTTMRYVAAMDSDLDLIADAVTR